MNMSQDEVGKLNKSAYGLVDAPFLWYQALVSELERLGFEASPFDACLFVLREPKNSPKAGEIAGVLGIHVDDGIGGGNSLFAEKIQELEKKYPFGSHRTNAFTFTGIELSQHGDHSITLSQSAYIRKIPSIQIDSNRKSLENEPVTEDEKLALRGLINWKLTICSCQYSTGFIKQTINSPISHQQSYHQHPSRCKPPFT